jgi:hypothetical protein
MILRARSAVVAQLQFQKDDAVTVRSWRKALSAVKRSTRKFLTLSKINVARMRERNGR